MPPNFRQFLFSTEGRISRSQLWLKWFLPFIVIFTLGTYIAFESVRVAVVLGALSINMLFLAQLSILFIFFLVAAWSFTAVFVKRIHDRNKSGWLMLVFWVSATLPITSIIAALIGFVVVVWFFIEFGCMRGTVGANRYGPDPVPQA